MPVTRISDSVDCSMKSGAGAWIGRRSSVWIGPFSSIDSPTTFMIRPSVALPTGMVIGPSVSVTSWPRTRPSVASIAMQRTVFSPRCWATSSTRVLPLLSVVRAFRISGSSSSNCTSQTAPITWVILPFAFAISGLRFVLERLCARDDFDKLVCDHGLARPVVLDGQPVDHVARVPGGVVHRRHARALLGGRILEKGREDLGRDAARQEIGEDFLLARLVIVGCRTGLLVILWFLEHRGDHLLGGRLLGDDALEFRIEDRRDVELARVETAEHILGDLGGVRVAHALDVGQVDMADERLAPVAAKLFAALLADGEDLHRLALGRELVRPDARDLHDRRVESAAKAALGGHHHEKMRLVVPGAREKLRRAFRPADRLSEAGDHRIEPLRVGTRRLGGLLRAAQFRRGDHLHRLGDLPGRLDRVDPVLEVLEAWHVALLAPPQAKSAAYSSSTALILSAASPFTFGSSFVIQSSRSWCFERRCVSSPCSNRPTSPTLSLSR